MSGVNGRRKWSAAEKLRVVLAGMQAGVEVADLCRREGINASQYYLWKKQLLGAAESVFNAKPAKVSHRETKLEHSNRRLQAVIAEITAENLELKKTLSD